MNRLGTLYASILLLVVTSLSAQQQLESVTTDVYDSTAKVVTTAAGMYGNIRVKGYDSNSNRLVRETYTRHYAPTDFYIYISTETQYNDPVMIGLYSNPNAPGGKDVWVTTKSVLSRTKDGFYGGYYKITYAAGGVDWLPYDTNTRVLELPGPDDSMPFAYQEFNRHGLIDVEVTPKSEIIGNQPFYSSSPYTAMDASLDTLRGVASGISNDLQGIASLVKNAHNPMQAAINSWNTLYTVATQWDTVYANIKTDIANTCEDYYYSRLGLTDPSDAYVLQGEAAYHIVSATMGGFIWKSAGKATKLRNVYNVPNSLKVGDWNTHVYLGYGSGSSNPIYVGITNDMKRRQYQHRNRFDIFNITDRETPLTRNMARGIEQAMIERARANGWNYENKINSISTSNPIYNDAVNFGNYWLQANGQ